MFVVYKGAPNAEAVAIEVSNDLTAPQIEQKLNLRCNWYGSTAATAEDAIDDADANGYRFKSHAEMDALRNRALHLGDQVQAFIRDSKEDL